MVRGLGAAFVKDLRLLARDRIGLVFLTLAPIIVITVAGFSLASLYGADPQGTSAYLLPVVDEDRGAVGAAIRERLAREPAVTTRVLATRAEALALLDRREAGAALVIPAGTSAAQEAGKDATLLLLTDPVKYLEIANLRSLVQELRHGIEREARERAAERLRPAAAAAARMREEFVRVAARVRADIEALRARLEGARTEAEQRRRLARSRAQAAIREVMERAAAERAREVAVKLEAELEPARRFLAELADRQRQFERWVAEVREKAGKLADRMPPPPAPPEIPAALGELLRASPQELARRLVEGRATEMELPALEEIEWPSLPDLPRMEIPPVPEPPDVALPGSIEIEETSVTGAPRRLNTFDQNVPGFSVTFLLLGMLFGVSMSLLDERDWGTLERLRSMPAPFSSVLIAKLASRVVVGMAQMTLLFAVGKAAFHISLGPQPWVLLLPTAGIVFAGTCFGLVVAGLAHSREAVLPIGSIVIVTMAAVGGCWWPIDLEPRWMRTVALGFPTTWAMAAYNDLMIRRQGLEAALRPALVLFLHGGLYLAVGLWLFHRREGRGG